MGVETFFKPDPDVVPWRASVSFASGTNGLINLVASPYDWSLWNMGSDVEREVRIVFKEDPMNFLQHESDRDKITVKQFNEADSVVMFVSQLQTNTVVVSGRVTLTVNDLKWSFDIPPQKPRWGAITLQKTNNTTTIKRIQFIDFVYPPRFTNEWYDGK
jgi:hypothetical protein